MTVQDAGRHEVGTAVWPQEPLAGRRGVVVGAASGIGRAVAAAAAASAQHVLVVDHDPSVRDLTAPGVEALVLDVTAATTPDRLADAVRERWGTADFLVNCAGIQRRGATVELPEDDWVQLFEANFHGLRRLSRPLVTDMAARGRGAVVNVTSSSVDSVIPGIVPYSTTKAALTAWTRGLAAELGPAGVRVNAVAPGYVATAMTAGRLADADFRDRVEARIPHGRVGQPEDVAAPILFLLSDAARYVTGVVLPVDGGYFLGA